LLIIFSDDVCDIIIENTIYIRACVLFADH